MTNYLQIPLTKDKPLAGQIVDALTDKPTNTLLPYFDYPAPHHPVSIILQLGFLLVCAFGVASFPPPGIVGHLIVPLVILGPVGLLGSMAADRFKEHKDCEDRFRDLVLEAKTKQRYPSDGTLASYAVNHYREILQSASELEGASDKLLDDLLSDRRFANYCRAHAEDGGKDIFAYVTENRRLVMVARAFRSQLTPQDERILDAACDMADARERVLREAEIEIELAEFLERREYEADNT